MKVDISGEFSEAQKRAHQYFIASQERVEPPIYRLPHNHPVAEETCRMSLPNDMVIVDSNFKDWFTIAIPFQSQPEHVVVLQREYWELRELITEWCRDRKSLSFFEF